MSMQSDYVRTRSFEERLAPPDVGGGGAVCSQRVRILVFGGPVTGHLLIPVTLPSVETANVDITLPATTTEVKQAFIDAFPGNLTNEQIIVTSPGGGLPSHEVSVQFRKGIKTADVVFGNQNDEGLENGWAPYSRILPCCG